MLLCFTFNKHLAGGLFLMNTLARPLLAFIPFHAIISVNRFTQLVAFLLFFKSW